MRPQLHLIGNAHLDPVWLWRWPEGCAEAIGTCWAAIDLLAEYPGVIFTRGEAVIYKWIEDADPTLFARIRDLVRSKRWSIVGGWWLQPDCNLPAGEAFIRQALYGKRYFREHFDIDVTVGYNVDSFGHAATLPMLLRHTGFAQYVFMRPQEHEKQLPSSLFDWVAPDGSGVRAFRIPITYGTEAWAPMLSSKLEETQALAAEEDIPLMCFYGIGNHGGGPTRRDLAAIAQFRADGGDAEFSDPAHYFAAVGELRRPTVQDELQMHAIGCYSAISLLKALNRQAEAHLAQAEAASALALVHAGAAYPHTALHRLWQTLLFNQFHDILCGTSVPAATCDAAQALSGVLQEADQLLTMAVRHLAATVAPGPCPTDSSFLVFNFTGAAQHIAIDYEPWTGWEPAESYQLLDDNEQEVAYQRLPPENQTHPGLPRIHFVLDVPAFGYQLYRFRTAPCSMGVSANLRASANCLENAAWHLEIDTVTGGIAALTDKRSKRELFSDTANLLLLVEDISDTWSHDLDRFGFEGQPVICEQIAVLEQGPVRASLRVRARAGSSTFTTTYLLHADPELPLEIRSTIDWHEHQTLLRVLFPLAFTTPAFRYEVPYGSVERPDDGREWPGQRWVLLTDGDGYGIALANDAKYSYAAKDGSLAITAVRSPIFAHHKPVQLDPLADQAYTDQGEQTFVVHLLAGPTVTASDAQRLADNLLCPPVATPHVARTGSGPYRAELLDLVATSSTATWLKVAEDSNDLVLRVLEHDGRADSILLPSSHDKFDLPPFGLLTLCRSQDGQWHECDGMESKIE